MIPNVQNEVLEIVVLKVLHRVDSDKVESGHYRSWLVKALMRATLNSLYNLHGGWTR